jgi:hypothetical protein
MSGLHQDHQSTDAGMVARGNFPQEKIWQAQKDLINQSSWQDLATQMLKRIKPQPTRGNVVLAQMLNGTDAVVL